MKRSFYNPIVILVVVFIFIGCNSHNQTGYKSLNDSINIEEVATTNSSKQFVQTFDTLKTIIKADSLGKTKISVFLPITTDIPKEGINLIQNILVKMLTQNGVCGIGGHPRFVITPVIIQTNQDITSTAPTMYSNTYDVSFYIADALSGDVYSSTSLRIQGVGQSPLKSFINAFSDFNTEDIKIQNFIKQGVSRINQYFDNNCINILKESNSLAAKEKYTQALSLLESVPSNTSCYYKISKTMLLVSKQLIDNDCDVALSRMKSELGKSNDPSASGYNEAAMMYYSMINHKAKCYKEADALYKNYIKNLNPKEKRDWELKIQQYKDDLDKNKQVKEFKVMQAQLAIEGNQELLDVYRKQYNYEKLPWIRQWIHLGSYDPFDGTK